MSHDPYRSARHFAPIGGDGETLPHEPVAPHRGMPRIKAGGRVGANGPAPIRQPANPGGRRR